MGIGVLMGKISYRLHNEFKASVWAERSPNTLVSVYDSSQVTLICQGERQSFAFSGWITT